MATNSFKDCFGKEVFVGDEVLYYSGNSSCLKLGIVKTIYRKKRDNPWGSGVWRITLESGSVISNPRITYKKDK